MKVFRPIWRVPYLLGFVAASLCANEMEYEGNYADNYDNEISQDQQEDPSPTPFHAAAFSRWEKLFIALEDSHMKQNMLLEAVEQCCRGMTHLGTQVDKLARGTWLPGVEAACGAQVAEVNIRLQREMNGLREEEAERETRLNATLQMLLSSSRVRWNRPEEDSRTRRGPTPTPAGPKEQEVTVCATAKERALVAVTTELEKVHLLLTRVIAQVETLRRDRGDI